MNGRNITKIVERYKKVHGNSLIAILQGIQDKYRYIPEDAIKIVSKKLALPLIDVYGVATFYNSFNLKPIGEHLIIVCLGTACHVRGGANILDAISVNLGIKPGETSHNFKFTLQTVNCLGCCAIGPIMVVDGEYYGQLTPSKMLSLLKNIGKTKDEKAKVIRRTRNTQNKSIKKQRF